MKIIASILALIAIFAFFNTILTNGKKSYDTNEKVLVSRYICEQSNPLQHILSNIWSMPKGYLDSKYRDNNKECFSVKFKNVIVHVTMRTEEYKGFDDDMFVFDLRCMIEGQKPYDVDYYTLNAHGMLVEFGNESKGKLFDRSAPYDHNSFQAANLAYKDLKSLHDEHKKSSFYAHLLFANLLQFYFENNLKPVKGVNTLFYYNAANESIFSIQYDDKHGFLTILPSIGEYNDMPVVQSGMRLQALN